VKNDLKEINKRVFFIYDRVRDVLFKSVAEKDYLMEFITERIKKMLLHEGVTLDFISEKLLSISEMLLDYYHYFVDLKRQTKEKNQLFINDILQEINKDVLKPLLNQKHPMAQVFPRASHWMAFVLLPSYKDKKQLFILRLRAVAEYSAEASAIVLIVMASRVRQGRHHYRYTDFLHSYIPLLTSHMIIDLDNLYRNQDHIRAKRMAFALINGLMVSVKDKFKYFRALTKWERVWRNRGVFPSKIIKESFDRFPEFTQPEQLLSRFAGGYPSGDDIKYIAELSSRSSLEKSFYEVLAGAHNSTSEEICSFQEKHGWVEVSFEIEHIKQYVRYERKTGLEGLFNIWSLGRSFNKELVFLARRLGFRGHVIRHGKKVPFLGYDTVEISPPASFYYLKTMFLYQMGAYENLIQHAGGNGVYLWRETLHGYEFIMFDHGRGVRDEGEETIRLEKLSTIFDYGVTFRKGKKGPGKTHKESGLGQSLFYLANETYLTRLISITKDRKIRIVEKAYPGKDQGETIKTVSTEFSFEELGLDYRYATGVIVQGFVPFDQGYRTVEFAPISPRNIIGEVVARNSEGQRRGTWQDSPKNSVLDELILYDEVEFVLNEAEEVNTVRSFTKTVSHMPSPASPQFVFNDGSTFSLTGIIKLESYGKEIVLSDFDDPLDAVNALGIFALDEVTVYLKSRGARHLNRVIHGIIEKVPSSDNQGVFVIRGSDGQKTLVGPEQVFEIRTFDRRLYH
jgi:hypothetical protein